MSRIRSPREPSLLARARLDAGLTLRDAAAALDLSHVSLADIEAGRIRLPVDRAVKLCAVYGVPLQQLLLGKSMLDSGETRLRVELSQYGLDDLNLPEGAWIVARRRREEVLAAALNEPDPRVLVRLPVLVLRAESLSPPLLAGFANHHLVRARVGWILDICHALVSQGLIQTELPSGIPHGSPWEPRPSAEWDNLGLPTSQRPTHRLWKRWRICAAVELNDFVEATSTLLDSARD